MPFLSFITKLDVWSTLAWANPKTWLIVTADGRFRLFRLFWRLVRRLFGKDDNTMWRIIQSFGTEVQWLRHCF